MPKFEYKAYGIDGQIVEGQAVSASEVDLLDDLTNKRLVPFYSKEIQKPSENIWTRDLFGGASLSLNDLNRFTSEASILLAANLPLDETLLILSEDKSRGRLSNMSQQVRDAVVAGKTLSEALIRSSRKFPAYYISVVAAGEQAGALNKAFKYLSKHLARQVALRQQLASALTYPAILIAVALVAVGIIITVLVPQLSPVFENTGRSLPFALAAVNALTEVLWQHWHVVFLIAALTSIVGCWAWMSPTVRISLDRLVLKLPLVGTMVSASEAARFARTVGTLQESGAPLLEALSGSLGLSRNLVVNAALQGVIEAVREGSELSGPLRSVGVFPSFSVRLIELGERTGRLEEMLSHTADILEADLIRRIDRVMSLVTPALTLIIGLGVGGLILSVMDAILSVNEVAVQ